MSRRSRSDPQPGADADTAAEERAGAIGSPDPAGNVADMHPEIPDLSYVIVSYNSAVHLGRSLDSLTADRGTRGRPIVVVDNASADGSVELARTHPSGPIVISESANLGFGTACNHGAKAAVTRTVFFINPDLELTPGASDRLLARLIGDPSIGAVGPAISDPSGEYRAASAGSEPSLRTAVGHFMLLDRVPVIRRFLPGLQLPPTKRARPVDWISGAAFLVRTEAFDAVGGFDPRMFLYMEDVDLSRRLREAGWQIVYEPAANAQHVMGGSQGLEAVDRWYAAFDEYVTRYCGPWHARAADLVAGIGLGARYFFYRVRGRSRQSGRMAHGSRAALRAAFRR